MKNKILTNGQISLLEEIGKNEFIAQKFYLTGGTALAGFYLSHRYSEDLDFFSETEFDILQIDIAVNKLFSIYQRIQARDFIDLYAIIKEKKYAIEDLIKKAKSKFDWHIDPLQLGAQFLKVKEVKDYPRMILEIRPEKLEEFFLGEAKKFKNEIIE